MVHSSSDFEASLSMPRGNFLARSVALFRRFGDSGASTFRYFSRLPEEATSARLKRPLTLSPSREEKHGSKKCAPKIQLDLSIIGRVLGMGCKLGGSIRMAQTGALHLALGALTPP